MSEKVQLYNFKNITTIPGAKNLIDIVLSQTQRKTPTEVHKQFKISRIRNFYTRKVKYCQQILRDRLQQILTTLPKLDDIHPFYSDLFNVLYDRDHYKSALGQVNAIKGVIDRVAKEYVKMLKYGSSLYRCKMLKRAALGRMCTAVKKLGASLEYLEEVRQHMGRLPSINPHVRTIILTGYPNVGKSSFMNNVSHANVDVQPYSFTTKSLYVGHFDYNYIRWQIIDTPGLLDHPLEDMNTIEMTAITALAHIPAAIVFIVDISEECGFKIEEQVKLFHSIKVLFTTKPIVVLLNKIDVRSVDSLPPDQKKLIDEMAVDALLAYQSCSTLTGEGIDDAKNKACQMLLEQRVSEKADSKKSEALLNRLYVTSGKPKPHNIPESILLAKSRMDLDQSDDTEKPDRLITEKELEDINGGPGVYSIDLRKNYILDDPSWKYDVIPEIYDGKNVFDFVDPEIDKRLKMLEMEEQLLIKEIRDNPVDEEWEEMQSKLDEMHSAIKSKQLLRKGTRSRISSTVMLKSAAKKAARLRKGVKSSRLAKLADKMELDEGASDDRDPSEKLEGNILKKSVERASIVARKAMGLEVQAKKKSNLVDVHKLPKGVRAESDRSINIKRPKHLFSGKRGIGKTSRR